VKRNSSPTATTAVRNNGIEFWKEKMKPFPHMIAVMVYCFIVDAKSTKDPA
jgi:hypothetical protein